MARRYATVQHLAAEAGVEVDDALVRLWDAGIEYVNGPRDLLTRRDVKRGRRVLDLPTRRELASPDYWKHHLGLSKAELDDLLANLGTRDLSRPRHLPSKVIKKLMGEARGGDLSPSGAAGKQVPESEKPPPAALTWETVGHERDLQWLSEDQVAEIHFALVEDFLRDSDPIDPPGVRSKTLLGSAVFRPCTSIGDVLKYPTVEMAAAALLHALVHDHPFHNGNKRTALVAMLVCLDENGMMLTCDEDPLFKMVLRLAQHALVKGPRNELPDRETLEVAKWIRQNSRLAKRGNRPISWRNLRGILSQYGCEFSKPNVGNRVNITRTVTDPPAGRLGRSRSRLLGTQTHYSDEGRDVEPNTVNKIRRDLELDDHHGIDTRAFYDNAVASTSHFIVKYRKTLRRLSHL